MTELSSGLSDVKTDSAVFSLHMKQPAGVSVGTDRSREPASVLKVKMLGPDAATLWRLAWEGAGRQCSGLPQ